MKDRLPGGRGVPLEDPQPYPEIRKNAENAPDWPYREEAAFLYRHASGFKDRFLDPVLLTDRRRLPDPVLSFEPMNVKSLAAYTLVRNPQGLLYEITFNTKHCVEEEAEGERRLVWRFGRWAQLETLLHEQVHLWQQNFGEDPVTPGRVYHNKEFIDKCESLGLHPKLDQGYHLRVADGLFAQYMKELGIEPPEDVPTLSKKDNVDWFKQGKTKKGRSTMIKWCCPECGYNVRVGRQGDPQLIHHPCSQAKGESVFFVHGDIYVAKE